MWDDKLHQNQGLGTWYLYVSSGKILDEIDNGLVCPLLDKDLHETTLRIDQREDKGL